MSIPILIVTLIAVSGVFLNVWLWNKYNLQRWTHDFWTPEMSLEEIKKSTRDFLESERAEMGFVLFFAWPLGILFSLFLLYGFPLLDKFAEYRDNRRVKMVYKIARKNGKTI